MLEQKRMEINDFRLYPVGNMERGRSLSRIRMVN